MTSKPPIVTEKFNLSKFISDESFQKVQVPGETPIKVLVGVELHLHWALKPAAIKSLIEKESEEPSNVGPIQAIPGGAQSDVDGPGQLQDK